MNVLKFKNGTVSVGDIFVSSWGYEQANVSFYQVISLHGKTTVTVREIRTNTQHTKSMMTGYKIPRLNDFCGEPLKRRVREFSCEPVNLRSALRRLKQRTKHSRKKSSNLHLITDSSGEEIPLLNFSFSFIPPKRVSLENGNFCTLSALFNQAPGGVRQEQPPLVNRFLSLPGCVIVTLANDGTEAAAGENLLQ